MRTFIAIASSLVLTCSAFSAEPELKGTAPDLAQYLAALPKTITLSSEAEVHVQADRAIVTLKVSTEHRSLQEALRANQELRSKLTDYFLKQGLSADRIQASRFSSTPRYGFFGEKAKSYRVDNLMQLKVRDEKEFQAVAGAVDSWPEVQYGGVEYEYAAREAAKAKALAQACDKAQEKKKLCEDKLGLSLIPVKFDSASTAPKAPAQHYGSSCLSEGSRTSESGYNAASASAASGADETGSAFGELVYTVQLTVEYAVKPK